MLLGMKLRPNQFGLILPLTFIFSLTFVHLGGLLPPTVWCLFAPFAVLAGPDWSMVPTLGLAPHLPFTPTTTTSDLVARLPENNLEFLNL